MNALTIYKHEKVHSGYVFTSHEVAPRFVRIIHVPTKVFPNFNMRRKLLVYKVKEIRSDYIFDGPFSNNSYRFYTPAHDRYKEVIHDGYYLTRQLLRLPTALQKHINKYDLDSEIGSTLVSEKIVKKAYDLLGDSIKALDNIMVAQTALKASETPGIGKRDSNRQLKISKDNEISARKHMCRAARQVREFAGVFEYLILAYNCFMRDPNLLAACQGMKRIISGYFVDKIEEVARTFNDLEEREEEEDSEDEYSSGFCLAADEFWLGREEDKSEKQNEFIFLRKKRQSRAV